ncbi:GIY-YIG nuclease family protein [Candidatus Dojkabacteria bacterium]|uniref:GIY-YIG nuclease family protein n=1 Tax=Candidatus Dojkabacteria bacterium TaxID=2099670 RepID=A0A955HXQ2_9BACT|nr:GIY-YIG nuclease family protein [Candidatus Dojkabacteria bacterium]
MSKLIGNLSKEIKREPGVYALIFNSGIYIGSTINIRERILTHRRLMKRKSSRVSNNLLQAYELDKEPQVKVLEYSANNLLLEKEQYYLKVFSTVLNNRPVTTRPTGDNKNGKTVYQYTTEGEYIACYKSARFAGKELKISSSAISRVCRDNHHLKSVQGFVFSYKKKFPGYENNSDKARSKRIIRNDGKIYDSIADAARDILEAKDNFDSICACISSVVSGKGKQVKGYSFGLCASKIA